MGPGAPPRLTPLSVGLMEIKVHVRPWFLSCIGSNSFITTETYMYIL
jgi:hypothetical protein